MPRKKASQPIDHPPVEINLYRRTAWGFGVIVLTLFAIVGFTIFGNAKVTVQTETLVMPVQARFTLKSDAQAENEVRGRVGETIVRASEAGASAGEGEIVPSQAVGTVTLFNNQSRAQTLIPTTRLLSEDGTLFRLKNRITIPARGQIEAVVYADKVGREGNIEPTRFTIPGLSLAVQKLVYAESVFPMTGGEVRVSVLKDEDLQKSYSTLKETLLQKAEDELAAKLATTEGDVYITMRSEVLEQSTDAKVGESKPFTVSMSLHVVGIALQEPEFLKKLGLSMRLLTPEYYNLDPIILSDLTFEAQEYDIATGEVDLAVTVGRQLRLTPNAPELAKKYIVGLSKEAASAYLESVEGVKDVQIKLPFYMVKLPKDEKRIKIVVPQG